MIFNYNDLCQPTPEWKFDKDYGGREFDWKVEYMQRYVTWLYSDSADDPCLAKFFDIISTVVMVFMCFIGVGFCLLYLRYQVDEIEHKIKHNKDQRALFATGIISLPGEAINKSLKLEDKHLPVSAKVEDTYWDLGDNFQLFREAKSFLVFGLGSGNRAYVAAAVKDKKTGQIATVIFAQRYHEMTTAYSAEENAGWYSNGAIQHDASVAKKPDESRTPIFQEYLKIMSDDHDKYKLLTSDEISEMESSHAVSESEE